MLPQHTLEGTQAWGWLEPHIYNSKLLGADVRCEGEVIIISVKQGRAGSHSVEQSLAINMTGSEARIDKKIVSIISIPKYPTMVQLNKTTPHSSFHSSRPVGQEGWREVF